MNYINAKQSRKGFTIVELLVIIVVIAILVAITIVSYAAVTNNARDQKVKTDAQGIAVYINKYKAEKGSYPASLDLVTGAPKAESDFQYSYDATNGTYCVTASVKGASAYVKSDNGTAHEGGCPGHGVNGESPITNLASDPAATTFSTPNTSAGWRSDRYGSDGTYALITNANDGPVSGLKTYARMTFSNAVAAGRGFHVVGNPEAASPGTNGMPVEEGKTYTVSAYMRSTRTSGGSVNYMVSIRFINASNAWVASSTNGTGVTAAAGSPTSNPGPWVRPSVTATAPTGAVRASIYIRESSAPTHVAGDRIEGTGLMITEGTTVYGYADGSSANWIWSGPTNASTSKGPAL